MAKKKKSQRKRNFTYAQKSKTATPNLVASKSIVSNSKAQPAVNSKIGSGLDLRFVTGDLRRIAVLAVGCITLEAVLWFLLHHTSLSGKIFG